MHSHQQNFSGEMEKPISVGEWMITFLILSIPVVGIIFTFIWAFGGNTPPSKQNYFRAMLIFMGIFMAIGLGILMLVTLFGFFGMHAIPGPSGAPQ